MGNPDRYVMLMSSLPPLGVLFRAKTPLSRLKLERRLAQLTAADAKVLAVIEEAFDWRNLDMETRDEDVIARAAAAMEAVAVNAVDSEALRSIIEERMELRFLIAALRRRTASAPVDPGWRFGRRTARIQNNWGEPGFGLERVFPWILEADRLMRARDALELERLILREADRLLKRRARARPFDFEAVVVYVLRWRLFERWSRSNGEAAIRRFDDLTRSGLGRFAALSFQGEP